MSVSPASAPDLHYDVVLDAEDASANTDAAPRLEAVPSRPTRIRATCDRGNVYPSDLVADVVLYRELRAKSLSGQPVTDEEAQRIEQFDARLRQSPQPGSDEPRAMRSFYRYHCAFEATVVVEGVEGSFEIQDISAGGVKAVGTNTFAPGDCATFVVDRAIETICFPARITWSRPDAFGLMFAGAAMVRPH